MFYKINTRFYTQECKVGCLFYLKGYGLIPLLLYISSILSNNEVFAFRCSILLLNDFAFFAFPVARHNIYKPIGVAQKTFCLDLT